MINNRLYILLGILLIILSFSFGYFLKPNTKSETTTVAVPKTVPLAFITVIETPKGTVYVYLGQDSIDFNPYETPYYPNAPIIKKEKYPKLFKQGITGFNALHAEYYKDSKEGETYIKFSNKQPDHGGFWDTYGILVDPFTGMVKEGKSIVDGLASF